MDQLHDKPSIEQSCDCASDLTGDVLIRIKRPEGYDGVVPQLVAEDFVNCPKDPAWQWEVVAKE